MPEQAQTDELPTPSAESVLIRVLVEAHVACLPRKKGERFLKVVADKLAHEEQMSELLHIRPSARRTAFRQAQAEAAELYRRWMPVFLARLPLG